MVAVATGWVWEDLGAAAVKRRVGGLEEWLEEWNRKMEGRGEPGGEPVRVVGLRRTGFLSLDFEVLDPGVGFVGGEGGGADVDGDGDGDGNGEVDGDGNGEVDGGRG